MLPNFVIIGAAKSGTTALYHYLRQHPDIYMSPVKEPRFFAFEKEDLQFRGPGDAELHRSTVLDRTEYERLFQAVSHETAIGEASPVYLCAPKAAGRIKAMVPGVKLIAILRNPVERAYSHFLHLVRDGDEELGDFSSALQAEEQRTRENWEYRWRYRALGFYSAQLERYYDAFDRGQIRVYLHEELDAAPQAVLRDIYRFLGVDESFGADTSVRYNTSGVPRSKAVHAVLSRFQRATQAALDHPSRDRHVADPPLTAKLAQSRWVEKTRHAGIRLKNRNLVKPQLPPEIRRRLLADFREDIMTLQKLIGRDLSPWLAEPAGEA